MSDVKKETPVVIITGGNNGIGYYMTKTLLEDGYKVAVFDLSGENLLDLEDRYKHSLRFEKCDVTKDNDVKNAVSSIVNAWNRIDILVNNACVAIFRLFEEKSLEETIQEFKVNYFGYIRMINEVLPYMKNQREGIIHNVSSGVGITGFTELYGYSSTKGAIEALTYTLSFELAEYGIQVSLIHPPLTNTKSASPLNIPPQVKSDPEIVGQRLAKKIQSKKAIITPDFQTSMYLFFARRYPKAIGKFMSNMAKKQKA